MSDTPKSPDDAMKLIDNGWTIILRKSGMGSVLAIAVSEASPAECELAKAVDLCLGWDGVNAEEEEREFGDNLPGVIDTDDFTISQALYRLAEKATTGRIA